MGLELSIMVIMILFLEFAKQKLIFKLHYNYLFDEKSV
jgi:hypothetical protein